MKTMTDFEMQQQRNEELASSGNGGPLEFAKVLILVLALTLAVAQPVRAWEDSDRLSNEGSNTSEEIRGLREDLKEERQITENRRIEDEQESDRAETLKNINDMWEKEYGDK